jgi:GntR family transcriptional repressor for pyruvate dehydrogenase complex
VIHTEQELVARPVRRTSTAEAIVDHLESRIRGGEFGPGDRLPSERQLQAELGVGRLALREGLARLCALGIIRVDHGKGAFVEEGPDASAIGRALVPLFADRSEKRLSDLVAARMLVEGELAGSAARRRDDDDVARLEALLQDASEAVEDERALAELDARFHSEVARMADNDFLRVMRDALAVPIRSFLAHHAAAQGDRVAALSRHWPIVEAIRDGDGDAARQAARDHVEACTSSLREYVEAQQSTGRYAAEKR